LETVSGKEGQGSVIGEDSILERVTVAAEERHLSHNSLIAYRRTWLKIIAWAAAQGLVLETFPVERVGEFYEEATRGRSASHHLQVKAALALLYHVLGSPNPFAQCHAPKFAPEKTELRYHTSSQLGQLLRELREDKGSYFGHLTYHLASALFFTGCRYHEWALLPIPSQPSAIDAHLQEERGLAEARQLEDERPRLMSFFEAIAGNDRDTLCKMLNEGMDPNAELPVPVPAAFQKRFTDENLRYYVASEKGFTALMFATALGKNFDRSCNRRLPRGQKILSYGEVAIGGILPMCSKERIFGNVERREQISGKTDIKQRSRPGRAGLLFQRHHHRGAAIPSGEISTPSIQQQRVVRAFGHRTHGHVAD
jgi:hypothetical protein